MEFTGQNQSSYQSVTKKRPKCGEQPKWLNLPSAKIVFTADTLKKKEFDAGFGWS